MQTVETVLASLAADLHKRHAGHSAFFAFRLLEEATETLRAVDLTVFTLEEQGQIVAFRANTRTKMLSHPSPEQREEGVWQVGSLEDTARMVWRELTGAGNV